MDYRKRVLSERPARGGAGLKDVTGDAESVDSMVAPATRTVNPSDVSTFLRTLLPDPLPDGLRACLWFNPPKHTYCFTDADQGAALVAEHGDGCCCYWGVGLSATPLPTHTRVTNDTCAGLLGIGVDIDLHDPDRKPSGLRPDAAQALLEALPVAPTCTIHSGHGMQAFWLFREPWRFDEADEHDEGALLCSAWIGMVEAAAKRVLGESNAKPLLDISTRLRTLLHHNT